MCDDVEEAPEGPTLLETDDGKEPAGEVRPVEESDILVLLGGVYEPYGTGVIVADETEVADAVDAPLEDRVPLDS